PVSTKQYDLHLQPVAQKLSVGKQLLVNVVSENAAVSSILASYVAELSDKQATTVNLQLFYPHPKRGESILHRLMERYLMENSDENIRLADWLLDFGDERLALVASELDEVEAHLATLRSRNRIADLSEQSKMLIGNANEHYKRL